MAFDRKRYMKKWRKDNREYLRKYYKQWLKNNPEYEKKWRDDNPDKCYKKVRKYQKSHPEKVNKWVKRYREKNPEKIKAQNISRQIKDKQKCSVVGCNNIGEKHHPDYDKPLRVEWLCKKHHKEKHRKEEKL